MNEPICLRCGSAKFQHKDLYICDDGGFFEWGCWLRDVLEGEVLLRWSGESYDVLGDWTEVIRHYDGMHLTYWRILTDHYITDVIPRNGLEDKTQMVIRIRRRRDTK